MMHACQRLMEDRSPGLLEAANVRIDVLEFEKRSKADAPPLDRTTVTTTYAPEHEQVTDAAMGDILEAIAAAEPAEDDTYLAQGGISATVTATHAPEHEQVQDDAMGDSNEATAAAEPADDDTDHSEGGNSTPTPTTDSDDSDYTPSSAPTSADEATEPSDVETEIYKPVRLHATTSRFDDWLHRGPWLHSLPFFIYMHNIKRVRKIKASPASTLAPQRFEFDLHYPLSTLY